MPSHWMTNMYRYTYFTYKSVVNCICQYSCYKNHWHSPSGEDQVCIDVHWMLWHIPMHPVAATVSSKTICWLHPQLNCNIAVNPFILASLIFKRMQVCWWNFNVAIFMFHKILQVFSCIHNLNMNSTLQSVYRIKANVMINTHLIFKWLKN